MRRLRKADSSARPRPSRHDDRGAITVLAAGSLTLVMATAAMGVDTGRVMLFDREMQTVVDNAATDASKALASRYEELCGQVFDRACLETAARNLVTESAQRNENYSRAAAVDDVRELDVEFGHVVRDSNGDLGFQPAPTGIPTALRVVGSGAVDYMFLPGTRGIERNAVGQGLRMTTVGCPAPNPADCLPSQQQIFGNGARTNLLPSGHVQVGSAVATVDDTVLRQVNGLLGPMLGIQGDLGVSAIGYGGLANVEVDLVNLVAQLCATVYEEVDAGVVTVRGGTTVRIDGCREVVQPVASGGAVIVGSPSSLLDAEVSVADLLDATADALDQQGGAASLEAATTLRTIRSRVDNQTRLRVGDLLAVQQGHGEALGAEMNVQQLLVQAAQVANGDNTVSATQDITLPSVTGVGVPATVSTSLALIERPQAYIGPVAPDAIARTAQLALQTTVTLADGALRIPIYVEGAGAQARLAQVECTLPISASAVQVPARVHAVYAAFGEPVTLGTPGQRITGGITLNANPSSTSGSVEVGTDGAAGTGGAGADAGVDGVGSDLVDGVDATVETAADPVVDVVETVTTLELASEVMVGGSDETPLDFVGAATWGDDGARTVGAPGLPVASSLLTQPLVTNSTVGTLGVQDVDALLQGYGLPSLQSVLATVDAEVVQPAFAAMGLSVGQARVTNYAPGCAAETLVEAPTLIDTITIPPLFP